jgi:hypothetical protein
MLRIGSKVRIKIKKLPDPSMSVSIGNLQHLLSPWYQTAYAGSYGEIINFEVSKAAPPPGEELQKRVIVKFSDMDPIGKQFDSSFILKTYTYKLEELEEISEDEYAAYLVVNS